MAATPIQPFFLPHGSDRRGQIHNLGIGTLEIKVTAAESQGAIVIAEIAHHAPGGPPRHVHPHQDEWFSVIAGRYRIEAGDQQFDLGPGDSLFGPRGIPHTWAYLGGEPGRIIFVITPAGEIEDFFLALGQAGAMGPQEPTFWQRYDLALIGPPLTIH